MDHPDIYSSNTGNRSSCTSIILLVLVWLYTGGISFGRIGVTLVASAFEYQLPESTAFTLAAGQAILLLIPFGLLARLWREPRYAGIYRAWFMAAGLVLLLAPIHLTKPFLTQQHAILHILLAWLYILLILFLNRRTREASSATIPSPGMPRRSALLAAVLAGGLFAYPWLALGALGSLLDTFLQAAAALSIGLAAAVIVETGIEKAFRGSRPTGQQYLESSGELFLVGFGASTALLITASATAFGYGGMQLILMLCLPSLGWIMAWLNRSRTPTPGEAVPGGRQSRACIPMGLLVGLALAAPMSLVDPSELHFLTSAYAGEIFQVSLTAAGISTLIGLFLSTLSIFTFSRERRTGMQGSGLDDPIRTRIPLVIVIAAWAVGIFIYIVFGQPGFYGESLFVILKDQASLSSYTPGQDYFQHRTQIYDTLVGHARESQTGLRSDLDRFGLDYTPYYLVNALEVRGGPLVRLWLSFRPEVDRILLNPWMRPLPSLPQPTPGIQPAPEEPPWNLTLIHADQVWDELGITGEGIVVGQSDSGVQADHPELAANYRGLENPSGGHNYNWFDPWYHTESPQDINGHGTHTLGTILGTTTGVAPGATWYACANLVRVFGNPALYLDCMQFMLAPFPLNGDPFIDGEPSLGAHITNNSWGCPELEGCDPNALLPAVQALRAAGVYMAVSAGNDGPSCESINAPPALYGEITSVGAIDQNGQLTDFSSRGPVTVDGSGRVKPDIVAPGLDILSAYPGNSYTTLPGTSMAGPHVAGTVALIWSANPALIGDIERTEQILARSAQAYTGSIPACPGADQQPSTAYGYGIVDAYEAVLLALDMPVP